MGSLEKSNIVFYKASLPLPYVYRISSSCNRNGRVVTLQRKQRGNSRESSSGNRIEQRFTTSCVLWPLTSNERTLFSHSFLSLSSSLPDPRSRSSVIDRIFYYLENSWNFSNRTWKTWSKGNEGNKLRNNDAELRFLRWRRIFPFLPPPLYFAFSSKSHKKVQHLRNVLPHFFDPPL